MLVPRHIVQLYYYTLDTVQASALLLGPSLREPVLSPVARCRDPARPRHAHNETDVAWAVSRRRVFRSFGFVIAYLRPSARPAVFRFRPGGPSACARLPRCALTYHESCQGTSAAIKMRNVNLFIVIKLVMTHARSISAHLLQG